MYRVAVNTLDEKESSDTVRGVDRGGKLNTLWRAAWREGALFPFGPFFFRPVFVLKADVERP
jgi:hypothetical protein